MTPVLGIIASSNQQGRNNYDPSSYYSLGFVRVTTATPSITFTSIPADYKYLELRYTYKTSAAGRARMQFNNDTTASYSAHLSIGSGSGTPVSFSGVSDTKMAAGPLGDVAAWSSGIATIAQYANPNVNTSMFFRAGVTWSTNTENDFGSGSYLKTDVITAVTLYADGVNWVADSTFALYGVK